MRKENGYAEIILMFVTLLVVSTSMYIYNSAQGTIEVASSVMSEQEKTIYNSAVSSYIGTNKRGVDVKSLMDTIIASNTNNCASSGKFIALEFTGVETIGNPGEADNSEEYVADCCKRISAIKSSVNMGSRYDIVATYQNGLIVKVTVTESTSY